MTTIVRIPWVRENDNLLYWNEVCAWTVRYFGMPEDRFTTTANVDYIEFVFVDNKDALLMSLHWNARIIEDSDLTTEFVGRYL